MTHLPPFFWSACIISGRYFDSQAIWLIPDCLSIFSPIVHLCKEIDETVLNIPDDITLLPIKAILEIIEDRKLIPFQIATRGTNNGQSTAE